MTITVSDLEAGIKPFHEWKAEQYRSDQLNRTPHTKEWYYSAYGGYCNKMRRQFQADVAKAQ